MAKRKNAPKTLKAKLIDLYEPDNRDTMWFTYGLLMFDLLVVVYLVATSFFYGNAFVGKLDVVLGSIILADVMARLYINKDPVKYMLHPFTLIDLAVVISLFLPFEGEMLAFLRVTRVYIILRSPYLMKRVKKDIPLFTEYEDVIKSSTNLFIFIFVMTAIVFETQVGVNERINNYLDALYFTVATLTTTGFGDVTMQGSLGKFLAVVIMIFGVSLFVRLIQTMFRAHKVRHECKKCGLYLHDRDASHCKACGNVINIPDEGIY